MSNKLSPLEQFKQIASTVVSAYQQQGIHFNHQLNQEKRALILDFNIHVQPGSKKDDLRMDKSGAIRSHLTVPPIEGAANRALIKQLGKALGCSPSSITIKSGQKGRVKRVQVELPLLHPKSRGGKFYVEKILKLKPGQQMK